MQQFEVTLKNDKVKSYRFFALLLLFLNIAIFLFLLYYDSKRSKALTALLFIGIYCCIKFFTAKNKSGRKFPDELIFFVFALSWLILQNYLLVFGCLLLGILHKLASQKLTFIFNNSIVQKLSFPKTEYSWDLFSNVIIKDKILTLDLKSNKLMQMEIEQEESINEVSFNEFARKQIELQNQFK